MLRLVLADPQQLGGGEPGQRRVGDHAGSGPRGRPAFSSISRHSAAVRWSFQSKAGRITSPAGVEEDRAVHLAAQADARRRRSGRNVPAASTRPTVSTVASHQSSGSCSDQPGRGWSQGYSADADGQDRPPLVDGERLGPGRPDVDAQRDAHGVISQRSPQRRTRGSTPAGSRRASAANASTGTVLKVNIS